MIAAADGEIFSFEMINWFEIAGLTGCPASEASGTGPKTKESLYIPVLSSSCSFSPLLSCRERLSRFEPLYLIKKCWF
jgi:hypothetical protein